MNFLKVFFLLFFLVFLIPVPVLARTTPEDIHQAKRSVFESSLNKITEPEKKQAIILADRSLKETNLTVCRRFDADIAKLSAILEEEKSRRKVTSTVVAYGQGDTPLDAAAYYLNYAAEALAYQKIQDYTPQIYGSNLSGAVVSSRSNLQSSLQTVAAKILRAKAEVKKALDYYEK